MIYSISFSNSSLLDMCEVWRKLGQVSLILCHRTHFRTNNDIAGSCQLYH